MYAVNMCTTISLYQVSVKTGLQPNHEVDMIMTGVMLHNITISIWLVNFMALHMDIWGRRGRDCMVVGFTTTYAIGAYHH
jgi:hypothetical protein